jgi:hypothetical protein
VTVLKTVKKIAKEKKPAKLNLNAMVVKIVMTQIGVLVIAAATAPARLLLGVSPVVVLRLRQSQ